MSREGLGASAGPQAPRWPPRRLHGKMLACNIPVKASLGCDVPREGGKGPGEMRGAAERHGRWLQERVSSRRRGARMDKYGLLARRQRQAPGGPLRATCALGGAEGKADPRRDPGRLREERPPRGWRCEVKRPSPQLPAEGGAVPEQGPELVLCSVTAFLSVSLISLRALLGELCGNPSAP